MNDFHEAVLKAWVPQGMGKVYKKAIEAEENPNGVRGNWNGNYAHVEITEQREGHYVVLADLLVIRLISRTLPNLQETVEWYERVGAEVTSTNYKGENQNG